MSTMANMTEGILLFILEDDKSINTMLYMFKNILEK